MFAIYKVFSYSSSTMTIRVGHPHVPEGTHLRSQGFEEVTSDFSHRDSYSETSLRHCYCDATKLMALTLGQILSTRSSLSQFNLEPKIHRYLSSFGNFSG